MPASDQILSVAQMRAAEDRLIAGGISVEALMDRAGQAAADWVWRIAGTRRVTVLCGPGNNGGDGYVLAEAIRRRGGDVCVVAPYDARTDAARNARQLYQGEIVDLEADISGEVFVDCLFGSGLTRPLSQQDEALLHRLAEAHRLNVAVDLPSGINADTGAMLSSIPAFDLTLALGAWKFAHFLMPPVALMGSLRLVEIGIDPVSGAARRLTAPRIIAPAGSAHKYTRGMLAIVGGEMPGAVVLAATAAQGAGAGYVRIVGERPGNLPIDLVADERDLSDALDDRRTGAILVGPGLGRDHVAAERLAAALHAPAPCVLDADALMLLDASSMADRTASAIATPHDGELAALERAFACDGSLPKPKRAMTLAARSGMVIVAKGPDTVVASPDGRVVLADRGNSWLSTAGTGDVLSGTIASRLATGLEAFTAACEGVWLHAHAARRCPPAFTAADLAKAVPQALADCL
ncbi:sugar kinase [Novosphingobium barchaimii]|nr:sugar kinase [Novosphingobium barchaimii]